MTVVLAPGETALVTLDRSAPAASDSRRRATMTLAELTEWGIAVESWDAGEPQIISEDRGLGYETREVRPTTAVTRLDAGTGALRPWKDIPEVGPEVSGIGEYTARFAVEATDGRLPDRTSGRPPAGSGRCA